MFTARGYKRFFLKSESFESKNTTCIAEVTGSNPVEALIQASSFHLLKLENLL